MEDSCTMYGIDQSRKTRRSGCLLAQLPLVGPPRRGLSCLCFWPPRPPLRGEAVCGLFASPPADLADGEASGSRSGLVSFSSPSALGSAKTANQRPCCYTERRGGANEAGEIQTVKKSIRLFPPLSKLHQARLWGFFNRRCHLMMTSSFKAAVKLNDDEPDSASTD